MTKAYKKESENTEDEDLPDPAETLSAHIKNYVTPSGFADLQNELRYLVSEERPKIVETVRWAAGNGDRSENGDYIYGKRRLREIDRRVRYLAKRIDSAEIVNPELQKNLTKVFFGATVTYAHEDGSTQTIRIVGIDEADLTKNTVSWISPIAKALLKSEVGDTVRFNTPSGILSLKIVQIRY